MKILHVVSGMDPEEGGVTSAVKNMVEGLVKAGINSDVVSLDSPEEPFIQQEKNVHGLGPARTAWKFSPILKSWLNDNLKLFDAVIVHGLWQYHVYAVYHAWKKIRVGRPMLLVMPHGMLDPYFQKAKGRKLKAIRNNIFWKLVDGKLINNADSVLFTCKTEQLLAEESFRPYKPHASAVVGLGINKPPSLQPEMLSSFAEKCGGVNPAGCLLFISRIHPKKGVDILIEAYCDLEAEKVTLPRLVIAGPGLDTEFGHSVKEKASKSPNIVFTGMLKGNEKWGAYYSCSAMILPSHQENFGFVVAESLACGKPVLISDQVNIWREIHDGNAGIVSTDSVAGIKEMILDWVSRTPSAQQEVAKNAELVYSNNFSLTGASHKLSLVINRSSPA